MLRVANVFSGILTFFSEHTDLINRGNTLSAMKFFNRVGEKILKYNKPAYISVLNIDIFNSNGYKNSKSS